MEINALGRLKMLFQRPYISKPSGGTCHGARDCHPPPHNKSNLATVLQLNVHVRVLIRRGSLRNYFSITKSKSLDDQIVFKNYNCNIFSIFFTFVWCGASTNFCKIWPLCEAISSQALLGRITFKLGTLPYFKALFPTM